jgi:hypothetical protein
MYVSLVTALSTEISLLPSALIDHTSAEWLFYRAAVLTTLACRDDPDVWEAREHTFANVDSVDLAPSLVAVSVNSCDP